MMNRLLGGGRGGKGRPALDGAGIGGGATATTTNPKPSPRSKRTDARARAEAEVAAATALLALATARGTIRAPDIETGANNLHMGAVDGAAGAAPPALSAPATPANLAGWFTLDDIARYNRAHPQPTRPDSEDDDEAIIDDHDEGDADEEEEEEGGQTGGDQAGEEGGLKGYPACCNTCSPLHVSLLLLLQRLLARNGM